MQLRKSPLVIGEIYHMFSKSIAGFEIFSNKKEFERIKNLISYYILEKAPQKFSAFDKTVNKSNFYQKQLPSKEKW